MANQTQRQQVRVGGFSIVMPGVRRGRVWLLNPAGEGMDVPVKRFEKVLAAFFRKHF